MYNDGTHEVIGGMLHASSCPLHDGIDPWPL